RLWGCRWAGARRVEPLKCRIAPASPTANTSLPELPQTPKRVAVLGLDIDHVVPSKCAIAPKSPTANTSLPELPHTPANTTGAPLVLVACAWAVQKVPS